MVQGVLIWTLGTIISLSSPSVCSSSSFSAVSKGTTAGGVAKELANVVDYGSKRSMIIRNEAKSGLRLWCASASDSIGSQHLNPGESLGFSFRPMVIGGWTVFWCTTTYRGYWARWDVFGKRARYGTKNQNDKFYVYTIYNDGVYYKGRKIRGLASGQYKYILWDKYDSKKKPYGKSLTGFIDRGMCNNIPGFMAKQTSDVTVCDNSCVILYSNLHCRGKTSRLQAPARGCMNFYLTYFNDRTMSVKGC